MLVTYFSLRYISKYIKLSWPASTFDDILGLEDNQTNSTGSFLRSHRANCSTGLVCILSVIYGLDSLLPTLDCDYALRFCLSVKCKFFAVTCCGYSPECSHVISTELMFAKYRSWININIEVSSYFPQNIFSIKALWDSLTDEWIKKLWYIYTMEYYSAIKRIRFESVLVRWMNPKSEREKQISYTNAYGI